MKPRAGDEVRITQEGRTYIGRVLGTAGENGSTRFVVRSTFSERIYATRDEMELVRVETDEAIRKSVIRGAVRTGGHLSKAWQRKLGLL
jgi:hypothetical protein